MKTITQPPRVQVLVLLGALFAATAGRADIDVWTGAFNGNWDTSTANWLSQAFATPTNFANGSPVLFDDSATGPTSIIVTTNVVPASMTFNNNSLAYHLSGGTISGGGGLTLLGQGTVTLSGANNFTGDTVISNGTLGLANSNALGSASSIVVGSNGVLDLSGVTSYTLGASASLTANGNAFSFPSEITGTTFNLGSRPVTVNFDAADPVIEDLNALIFNGNPMTVNSPSPLNSGVFYLLIQNGGSGLITNNATSFPAVTGTAVGSGRFGYIAYTNSGVYVFISAVPVAPFFLSQPTNVTVAPGTNVTFSAQAGGPGPFSYQWLLNGTPLAGATNSSLPLTFVQPTNGGSYNVMVVSPFGVTNSQAAVLLVTGSPLGMTNDFYTAPFFQNNQMTVSANNVNASPQPGEPNHGGKGGRHPVWLIWQAQGAGIATFFTLGSAYDSVLAVYTNNSQTAPASLTNLTAVTDDDDSGAYLTSTVQFNAAAGQFYYVAVDGCDAAQAGNIILSWQLQLTTATLPVIRDQPVSYVAAFGETVTFDVQAKGGTNISGFPNPVFYQWTVDGLNIPGATNSSLVLSNVQPANAGNYAVRVNNGLRTVLSQPAFLQLSAVEPNGAAQLALASYKLGNTVNVSLGQAVPGHIQPHDGLGSAPVTGLSGTHYFSTTSTPTIAAWFSIQATNSGAMLITTEGSGFANNFTVYSGPASAISTYELTTIASAIANGYKATSRTSITATSGAVYYVQVFGNGSASGKATLNWAFNYHAAITRPAAGSILGTSGAVLTDSLDPPDNAVWSTNQTTIAGPAGTTTTQAPLRSAIYGVANTSGGSVTRDLVYQDVSSASMSARISGSNIIISYGANTAARTIYIESSSTAAGLWTVIKTLAPSAVAGSITNPLSGSATYYRYSLTNP